MHAIDEEYVTVAEAATLLRVAPSTIRRWIREGDVPAYRVGRRRVALKRDDLSRLITPARLANGAGVAQSAGRRDEDRRLTLAERQRALEAMERAQELRKQVLAERGGKLFPPAWETLAELRDERSRQLS